MKKQQSYLILLLALLLAMPLNAKVNHLVGAYANLGEWSLLLQEGKYGTSFGVAGGIGGLYELQAGPTYGQTRFLLDIGVGAWGGMTSFMQASNQDITLPNQTDLDGETFDYVYELRDRQDQYRNVGLSVPVMVGVLHRKFYMLAGVKLGANLYTKTHSEAMLTTYGQYVGLDPFVNMPEYQFFNDLPVSGGVKTDLNFNMDLSIEVGGRLNSVFDGTGYDVPKSKIDYRLAAFIDYGLLDLHTAGTAEPLIAPTAYNSGETAPVYNTRTMVDKLVMNDIMSTEGFARSVNNFMIGLKFTVLFQLPEPGTCILCRDSHLSSARRGGGGGVKYEE